MLFICKSFMLCFQMLSEKKIFFQEMVGGRALGWHLSAPSPPLRPFCLRSWNYFFNWLSQIFDIYSITYEEKVIIGDFI